MTAAAAITASAAVRAAPSLPNLAYAKAQVARYRAVPRWTAPGPAIAARKAAGKRVAVVPLAAALPYQQQLSGGLRVVATAVGIVLEEQPGEGQPAQWAQGVERAIAQRRVRIGTVDGSESVLRMIQQRADKGLVLFDVGYSLDWQGWADLDVILRVLLGLPVPKTQNLPRRIFDATNVNATGTPPLSLKGYGDAYRAGATCSSGASKGLM